MRPRLVGGEDGLAHGRHDPVAEADGLRALTAPDMPAPLPQILSVAAGTPILQYVSGSSKLALLHTL